METIEVRANNDDSGNDVNDDADDKGDDTDNYYFKDDIDDKTGDGDRYDDNEFDGVIGDGSGFNSEWDEYLDITNSFPYSSQQNNNHYSRRERRAPTKWFVSSLAKSNTATRVTTRNEHTIREAMPATSDKRKLRKTLIGHDLRSISILKANLGSWCYSKSAATTYKRRYEGQKTLQ